VAIVTGAGRGIGAAVATRLAAEGAAVIVADLGVALDGSPEGASPGEQVAADIVARGGRAVACGEDVADFDGAGRLVGRAVSEFGRVDILVNMAGILRDRMIWNMTPEEWDAVIAVHLRGAFNTSRHVVSHWREVDRATGRRIIHCTSASGLFGAAAQPNYAAAKMGVVGLTYSTANAVSKLGATCNAISPAADTRMTLTAANATPDRPERAPDQVATTVAWLASDAADWCNGQVLSSRGGDVSLYAAPRPVVTLHADSAFTLAELTSAADREFRPIVTQLPAPTWPPFEGTGTTVPFGSA
jgi:NAD(P)-dependent dehydrogenase (short-subunit alcohol dehydrogenase family)